MMVKGNPFILTGVAGVSEASRAAYKLHLEQSKHRRNIGRYKLEEAADYIVKNTSPAGNISFDEILYRLVLAVANDELPAFEPNSSQRYVKSTLKEFHEEVCWCHLNDWLNRWKQLAVTVQFPKPLEQDLACGEYVEPTFAQRRAMLDVSQERGCRGRILQKWNEIERLFGPKPEGRKLVRHLNLARDQKKLTPKTVQNALSQLRHDKLIP